MAIKKALQASLTIGLASSIIILSVDLLLYNDNYFLILCYFDEPGGSREIWAEAVSEGHFRGQEMQLLESLAIWNGAFMLLGLVRALIAKDRFNLRWFAAALILFNLNVAMVLDMFGANAAAANVFGLRGTEFNWIGKIVALIVSLAILASRFIGPADVGATLQQGEKAKWGWTLVVFMFALSLVVGWFVPDEPQSVEAIAYQLTMPSLEEELFYRGILLYCLIRAFGDGRQLLAANFGYAALVSTIMFTIIHGLFWGEQGIVISPEALIFAGIFGILLTWLRLNTGSLAAPILLHSIVNTVWRLI